MLSRFLPTDFDATKPIALVAGQGLYPVLVADAIRRAGVPLRLIAFKDETRPDLFDSVPEKDRRMVLVGQLGKSLRALREMGAGYALMAGQITPRRLFSGLHPDLGAIKILFSLKRRNAETIFGAIATEVEKNGVRLLDARCFIDDQLATAGVMTGAGSGTGAGKFPIDREYLDHGIHIARESARLDIGQGCVVRKGTVLAVEAFDGTDNMLRRAGALASDPTLFVKLVKTDHDYRFDVPVFGEHTLEVMRECGIRAVALQAGSAIILDKPNVIAQAKSWGISLLGFE